MSSKFDEMLYELALSANKPRYWAERLRREARDLRRSASEWDNISTGIKVPWIEAFGGRFDTLPHEAAMLFLPAASALTVSNDTWTDVVGYDDPYLLDPDATASHAWGFKVDAATGLIYVENVPKESLVLLVAWGAWEENNVGKRSIKWVASDASERRETNVAADTGMAGDYNVGPQFIHLRPLPTGHTWYKLQVHQDSGGDLDYLWAGFVVVRLT